MSQTSKNKDKNPKGRVKESLAHSYSAETT